MAGKLHRIEREPFLGHSVYRKRPLSASTGQASRVTSTGKARRTRKPSQLHLVPFESSPSSVQVWFDGAAPDNGRATHASYGLVVKSGGQIVHTEAEYIGYGSHLSNNVSEYCGAVAALTFLIEQGITSAVIFGDSRMVIQQLNGRMKARAGAYLPYHRTARDLRAKLPNVTLAWVPRAQNGEADALAAPAIEQHCSD